MAIIQSAKDLVEDFLNRGFGRVSSDDRAFAKDFFEEKKREVISLVNKHPVSRELVSHISPSTILGTPASLFGFLGIQKGVKPMNIILDIINKKMTYSIVKRRLFRGLTVNITFPTKEDFRVPELIPPYSGGLSIIELIENGVPGLQNLIKSSKATSRSREGLQSQREVRGKTMIPIPWITYIFAVVKDPARKYENGFKII